MTSALNEAWSKKRKYAIFIHKMYSQIFLVSVTPFITRQIRSSLTKEAEKASIDVFAMNLKQLLLLHPMKGKKILGIDPGFNNGCKIAMISERNDLLETAVIYPHTQRAKSMVYGKQIASLMKKHK